MTFSLLFIALFSSKLSVKSNLLASSITGADNLTDIRSVVKYVILFTFSVEITGALLLFVKFVNIYSFKMAIFNSIFHSVSAFCNAGFSTFSINLAGYSTDLWINLVIMSLIVIGGIGFIVVYELNDIAKKKKTSKQIFRLSLHSRLTLVTTGLLIFIGAGLLYFFEYGNITICKLDFSSKLLASLFHSISARTAGFNTINIAQMTDCGLITLIILMFIGGSPASTAGGIKTTTFALLMLTLTSMIRDNDRVEIYGKRINKTLVNKTIAIVTVAIIIIICVTTIVLYIEHNRIGDNQFIKVFFETVSALGTVGLSMDLTPKLTDLSKMIYIGVMFIGRVGAITFMLAFVSQEQKINYKLPEEKIIIS